MTQKNDAIGNRTSITAELSALSQALQEFRTASGRIFYDMKLETKKVSKMRSEVPAMPRRPVLAGAPAEKSAHEHAFNAYIRRGDESELRHIEVESKSLTSADSGFLIDPMTSERIESSLRAASSLRAIANVVQVEAGSYDVLVDHGDFGAGWISEQSNVSESSAAPIERISIAIHELAAMPKASQRLLEDSAFDIEGWLSTKIADSFSQSESLSFISGSGGSQPSGVLSAPRVKNDAWSWGNIGYVISGAEDDFASDKPADAVVDLVYALPAQYRRNATFVMNSKTAGAVRKMKDSDGRFLWNDSFSAQEPARLMGYPVLICEDMPDIEEDSPAMLFGDFARGYTIAERPDLRILRDPFSAKPHVLFYATKRVGGAVTDFAAIKALVFAAA